ncbi:unnamed protein product [Arctia plantaginis]|uniref:Uncharacterized protein n=1 Tax=Arctia plantaginis TaxID=874455 RepID=A0A8S0ZZC3_ARCPL|nr:unnamed protein product [Arctia plantaginis]
MDGLVTRELEDDQLLSNAKTSGVKCDIIINECKVFLEAEDGGGDVQFNTTATMIQDNQDNNNIRYFSNTWYTLNRQIDRYFH